MRTALALLALLLLVPACSSDDNPPPKPAALPSAACDRPAVAAGESEVSITSGGTARAYFRHVPLTVTKRKPLPLVVDFHGYGEPAAIHLHITELGKYGDTHGFVTLTPEGTGSPVRWDASLHSADTSFINDMLDQVEEAVCIDTARVYATGLSDGAFVASSVGCSFARVAAIAPVAGVRDPDGCRRRVPVLAIHGTKDRFVAYTGGLGEAGLALPAPDGSGRTVGDVTDRNAIGTDSIPKIVATWARRDRCNSGPTTTKIASDVELVRYECPDTLEVELYRVIGGGHTWPGTPLGPAIEGIVGHTTTSISANSVIWRFFRRHPLVGQRA